ncbi:toprim domain-containing protein [Candidatus Woesearchaeota archaeon]|nr:toprim domain-containing protein [Candidatus Woesearchaeota archaeon]
MAKQDAGQLLNEQVGRLSNVGVVIVEGKKDKIALEKLGVKNIITISKPLYLVIDEAAAKAADAAILTDLDREGRKLYSRLSSGLQMQGVAIDNSFRNFLFRKTKLRQIEGIYDYFYR